MEWMWSYFFNWGQFSPGNQPLKLSVRHKNTKCSSFPKNWSFSTKLFTSIQYLILSKYSDTCPNIWTRRVSNAQKDRLYRIGGDFLLLKWRCTFGPRREKTIWLCNLIQSDDKGKVEMSIKAYGSTAVLRWRVCFKECEKWPIAFPTVTSAAEGKSWCRYQVQAPMSAAPI